MCYICSYSSRQLDVQQGIGHDMAGLELVQHIEHSGPLNIIAHCWQSIRHMRLTISMLPYAMHKLLSKNNGRLYNIICLPIACICLLCVPEFSLKANVS